MIPNLLLQLILEPFQCVEALSESNSSLAVELCDLLTSYEMEGLLQAHDSIASLTDRVYCSPANMHLHAISNSNLNTMPAKTPLHQTLSNNLQNDSKGYSSSTEDIKKVKSMNDVKEEFILFHYLILEA